MDLELETLVRKRFYVGAIKVTEENMQEVAKWCGGRVNLTLVDLSKGLRWYIRIPLLKNRAVRGRAFAGDYVLQLGDSFRAYTEASLWEFFERPGVVPNKALGDVIYDENTDSLVIPGASVSISAKEAAKQIHKMVKEGEARIEFDKLVKKLMAGGPGSFETYILVYYVDGVESTGTLPEGHDCLKSSCVVVTEPSRNFFDYRTVYKIFHKHRTEISDEIDLSDAAWHYIPGDKSHLVAYCFDLGCGGI